MADENAHRLMLQVSRNDIDEKGKYLMRFFQFFATMHESINHRLQQSRYVERKLN